MDLSKLVNSMRIFASHMNTHQQEFPEEKALSIVRWMNRVIDINQLLYEATSVLVQWACVLVATAAGLRVCPTT